MKKTNKKVKKKIRAKVLPRKEGAVVFRARIINPISPDKVEEFIDGALAVGPDGKIIYCGEFNKFPSTGGFKIMDKRGFLVIPGLVDCHTHLPQLDMRGKHGSTLLEWLERYTFPAEKAFANLKYAEELSKRFFKKLILNGTTTAAVYSTIHARSTDVVFEVAKESGVRAIIGKVMMDQHSPAELLEDTHASLKESETLCAKWHNAGNGRLKYAFTPRFAPTCSETLMSEAGKLAEEAGAYIQSHIAETIAENGRVKELFPDYDNYTQVYEENNCMGERTVMGHAIHLSPNEMRRFALTRTKIAHCPSSNFFLKSGRFPVELIEEYGIHYGLGTDVGAGTSMSLFTTMRHADYIQPHATVTPAKALFLATLGGARALSLGDETGNFARGKSADFNIIDICGIDPRYGMKELDCSEVLSLLMYRGMGNAVKESFVAGKRLDVDVLKIKGER